MYRRRRELGKWQRGPVDFSSQSSRPCNVQFIPFFLPTCLRSRHIHPYFEATCGFKRLKDAIKRTRQSGSTGSVPGPSSESPQVTPSTPEPAKPVVDGPIPSSAVASSAENEKQECILQSDLKELGTTCKYSNIRSSGGPSSNQCRQTSTTVCL